MNPTMKPIPARSFALLLALLVASGPLAAQTSETFHGDGRPIVKLSDIALELYPVQNVDPSELFNLATSLVGRSYYVQGGDSDPIESLRLLGTRIVLYDTLEQVKRARELLARLDVKREETRSSWKSLEYRPRFVSLKAAQNAVEDRVSAARIDERGLLVLSADGEALEGALALLARIDVPEKQVLLTCQLVEVGGTPQGPPLAKALLENLQRLLPGSSFTQTGFAMLQTSVGGDDSISMSIESPKQDYRLSFRPVAYDERSGALTVVDCKLMETILDGSPARELFRTNTVLRGGEYTVLAATGATPKLLVLRVTPQE